MAVLFAMELRDAKFMIGTFFEAAVVTSAVRAIAEAAGALEIARTAWRRRHHGETGSPAQHHRSG
ncbi:hypothetical protein OIB37_29890 [Streptomyces sp. NBC_00820]|uniref:hypothetical protein n=1 Tax=Streptomyces sp. NBC_00820 TaxID=2975842 RepID=UPI002ED5C850|nr:hypothetical protein OIB37_29890 [Streptomyces sp. NBC_00820]